MSLPLICSSSPALCGPLLHHFFSIKPRPVFAEEEAVAEEAPVEVEEEAPAPPPAPKMTAVEYLDTMYGGIGPENGKILGTGYPPAAVAIAKLGTPATLDFMR